MPIKGEHVTGIAGFEFEVLQADSRQVKRVKIKRLKQPKPRPPKPPAEKAVKPATPTGADAPAGK